MNLILEQLDQKLLAWPASVTKEVLGRVQEIIEAADDGFLDIGRSRAVEQEVLDLLDEN